MHRGFASNYAIYDETDGQERTPIESRQDLPSQRVMCL